jgi:hypothetical protein
MRKECFLPIAVAFMLAVTIVPYVLCFPPAGLDHLDPTTAAVELEIGELFTETIIAEGSTTVSRGQPYDPGDGHITINTEIIFMDLKGNSTHIGPINITESPSKTSNGRVRQLIAGVDFPAESFFNVFIEIQTVFGTFHNDDPALMSAKIQYIPPWEANYTSDQVYIPLKNETGSVLGHIKHVWHKIGLVAGPGGFATSFEKPGLLAPYVGLTSVIVISAVATAICINRNKRRKEKH